MEKKFITSLVLINSLPLPGLSGCYTESRGRSHCSSMDRSHDEQSEISTEQLEDGAQLYKLRWLGWSDSSIVGGFNTIIRIFSNTI